MLSDDWLETNYIIVMTERILRKVFAVTQARRVGNHERRNEMYYMVAKQLLPLGQEFRLVKNSIIIMKENP